jgi:excisionase family DNA binding protein
MTGQALNSIEAARYLGVSIASVRRWSNAGHLPCWRTPGGQRRFSEVALREFIAAAESRERKRRQAQSVGA